MSKAKVWAVVDEHGHLLHQKLNGTLSFFRTRKQARFLAKDWADPSEKLRVVRVEVKEIKPKKK